MSAPEQSKTPDGLLSTYILAGIGFACLIGWELSAVFSPALPLLSFCTIQEATFLRIVSVFTLAAAFVCFAWKQDWVFAHRNRLLSIGSLLALVTVANTAVNLPGQWMPLWVSVVAWALFGAAQASIALYWCIFFSLIPTRRTAMTISVGAVGGTALYIFANSTGTAWLSLAEITVLIVGSVGLAAFLSTHAPIARVLPVDEYRKSAPLTLPATFSVACHGAVYGFMSLTICTMGLVPAVIVGASGFAGSLLAVVWARLGSKVEIDTGIVQRISLPVIVAGLLLFPFFDETGKIVCGCLVNIALAHSSIVTWCSTSVDNAEFQLHPVRFASRQAPNWVGFLFGTVFAYAVTFVFSLSDRMLEFVMALFVVLVIIVFSIYGGNESSTKKTPERPFDRGRCANRRRRLERRRPPRCRRAADESLSPPLRQGRREAQADSPRNRGVLPAGKRPQRRIHQPAAGCEQRYGQIAHLPHLPQARHQLAAAPHDHRRR